MAKQPALQVLDEPATTTPEAEDGEGALNTALFTGLLEELNRKSSAGDFAYLQAGRTQLRLRHDPRDKNQVYAEVQRMWAGQARKKYLIRVIVMPPAGSDQEAAEKMLVLPKTVLQQIISLAAEGYELFQGNAAHGITVTKNGEKLETSYTVMPSRKPVMIPEGVEPLDMTLAEAVSIFETQDRERDEKRQAEGKNGTGGSKKKNETEGDWE